MLIDYQVTKTFNNTIDIVDAGNTALRCSKDNEAEWYMIIKTVMGKTNIIKFGPVVPDIPILTKDFKVEYESFDYKESKLAATIDKYINDGRKEIDKVEEVVESEAWECFPNIQELFENV